MGFERYERSDGPSTDEPLVSLRASGSIGLNNATVEAYFESDEYAVLYYDAETRRVGIRPADDETGQEYAIQRGEEPTHGATLNAAGFMREYDLLPDRTTRYPTERVVLVDVDAAADTAHTAERDGVTVSVVPDPADLTGIGIPVADHGNTLREGCDAVVVCLDSYWWL